MMSDTITLSLQQGTTTFFQHTSYAGSSAERIIDISSRPLRISYIVKATDTYAGTSQTMDFVRVLIGNYTPFGNGRGYFGYRYIENGSYYCEYLFTHIKCEVHEYTSVPNTIFWNLFMKPSSGTVYNYSMTFDSLSRSCLWLHVNTGSYTLTFSVLTDVQASAVLDWLHRLVSLQSGVVRTIT